MADSNSGSTVKWIIPLAVTIVMGFIGWMLFAVNSAKVKQMDDYRIKIEQNIQDIGILKVQYGVVITKLEYLEKSAKKMIDWESVISTVLSTSVIVATLGWVARGLFSHFLSRDLQTHKGKLESES